MAYRATAQTEQRKQQVHADILKAGKALVSEAGFRALSMAAVAERAGIATGTLYRYFASKTDLCVAIFSHATEHEIQQVKAAARDGTNVTERLRNALITFAQRALQNPALAYALIAEPAEPELDQARLDYRAAWADSFATLIREGVRKGEFQPQPERLSAAAMVGAMAEALITPAMTQSSTTQRQRQIQQVVQFCLRAV
ncbi:MAG TPA: TetR/AcrR family transcriptional regulator, partial [Dongiaceae bacterium]|nr:TetR/AcrR family transcriptional regulator [Dongiaceae bacterium]